MFGRRLVSLRLIGHELGELPTAIGESCLSLTSLSLASNNLALLPDSLCNLTKLIDINLLRNRLTALPASIGDLAELRTLQIASNRIEARGRAGAGRARERASGVASVAYHTKPASFAYHNKLAPCASIEMDRWR